MPRSWLFAYKTARLLRIPARSDDAPAYWETEDGQVIQLEDSQPFELEEDEP